VAPGDWSASSSRARRRPLAQPEPGPVTARPSTKGHTSRQEGVRAARDVAQSDQGPGASNQLDKHQPADSSIQVGRRCHRAWPWRNMANLRRAGAEAARSVDSEWRSVPLAIAQQPAAAAVPSWIRQAGCAAAQAGAATVGNGWGGYQESISRRGTLVDHQTLKNCRTAGASRGDREWPGQGDRQGGGASCLVRSHSPRKAAGDGTATSRSDPHAKSGARTTVSSGAMITGHFKLTSAQAWPCAAVHGRCRNRGAVPSPGPTCSDSGIINLGGRLAQAPHHC